MHFTDLSKTVNKQLKKTMSLSKKYKRLKNSEVKF
ncbi:hypothetical protein CF65_02918 [Aggregatibacter actinomycetemcomitans HK1651]|nr:hypothetical protein CF65_02918 [Aggregatibacter actinomycetemcomitans HK1651]